MKATFFQRPNQAIKMKMISTSSISSHNLKESENMSEAYFMTNPRKTASIS